MENINYILKKSKLKKCTPFVIGVSGGVDSMMLLSYLHANDYNPIVVHFNHNTRKTNKRDQDFVVNYCKKNNIKYYIKDIVVENGNFHEESRNLRYDYFKEIAYKHETPYILTGHHLDDLAETILIKITRGSNLHGYAGIHPVYKSEGYTYVRPLLYTDKSSIVSYVTSKHIPHFEDESNVEDTYLRNRYRHTIIPILKQENNQFLERVKNYHLQLSGAADFIRYYSSKFIINNTLNLKKLLKESKFIQENVLAQLLEYYEVEFTYETLQNLVSLINSDKPNQTYDLKNNKRFIKAYSKVFIVENEDNNVKEITLQFGENKLTNMKTITLLERPLQNSINIIEICYNKLRFPLKVRNRKPGDILQFNYGRKKLKDFLIDEKVPQFNRDDLLIITDSNDTILWVENLYTNRQLGEGNIIYIEKGDIVD